MTIQSLKCNALGHEFAEVTQPNFSNQDHYAPYTMKAFSVFYTLGGLLSGANQSGEVSPLCKSVVQNAPSAFKACDIGLNLSKMELRRRYKKEANAHRAMMSRRAGGALVHPSFEKFADFIQCVGLMPANGCTLDRIDNNDPEYAPGKVRWADRRTQNNNKGDTLTFYYSRTGDVYTTSRLAALQKVSTAAIRKRRAEGWTDAEIVEGKRAVDRVPVLTVSKSSKDHRPSFSKVEHTLSAVDIQFSRDRATCEAYRKETGQEYFPANPQEVASILNEGGEFPIVPRSSLDGMWSVFLRVNLPRWWQQYKPHIVFERLSREDQALIAYIDPDYLVSRASHLKRIKELAADL